MSRVRVTVRLAKRLTGEVVSYGGELIEAHGEYWLIASVWRRPEHDLGLFALKPGDHLSEYFFLDRWFTIFEASSADGRLKGWYCSVSRPASVSGKEVYSVDLALDLVVSADRRWLVTLDEEEFAQLSLTAWEREQARAALTDLRAMAIGGRPPFAPQ